MGLSARVFGFSSLQHAAAAGAVHDRRRRRCCSRPCGGSFGPAAGMLAAAALAHHAGHRRDRRASTTLTRCSCCCSSPPRWLLVRALESGRTKHLVLGGRGRRPRLHDEDAARAGWSCRRWPPPTRVAGPPRLRDPHPPARRRRRRHGRGQRRVAARRDAVAGLGALHRRQHGRLGLGPDPRLQRLRPPLRRRGRRAAARASAAPPACGGCSTSRSAARSPGCSRSPRVALVAGPVADAARAAHRPAPRRLGALRRSGRSSTSRLHAPSRASSTPTT